MKRVIRIAAILFLIGWVIQGVPLYSQTKQAQSLFALGDIDMTFGGADRVLPMISDQGLPISYQVIGGNVVALKTANSLSVLKAGTASLRAYNAGSEIYLPFEKIVAVRVLKAYQTVRNIVDQISLTYGDSPYALVMKTDQNLPLSYSFSQPDIVRFNNGAIEVVNAGITTLSGSNPGNENYNSFEMTASVQVEKGRLSVLPADHEMIYGDTLPLLSIASISGFRYNDSQKDITLPILSTVGECMPVGEYPIYADRGVASNYDFVYQSGVLKIRKAPLDVFARPAKREYGVPNPLFRINYQGFKCTDDSFVVQNMKVVTNAQIFSEGSYGTSVNPSYFYYYLLPDTTDAFAQNYYFITHQDTLTITKAPLQVKADSVSFLYGDFDKELLSKTFKGFKFNDYEYSKVSFDVRPYFETEVTVGSSVGAYPVFCTGGISRNYELTYALADTISIKKAPLYLTANSAEKEYGEENPTFDFVATGFKNGEDISVLFHYPSVETTADLYSGVGTYPTYILPTDAQNYYMVYLNGILTVDKAPLSLTIDSAFREPLELNPDFQLSSFGWKFKEDSILVTDDQIRLWSDAIFLSPQGAYLIHADTKEVQNYLCSYQAGTLVVGFAQEQVLTDRLYRLYPSVVTSYLKIEGIEGDEKVLIYNKDGVLKGVFENGEDLLDLSAYQDGFYIVRIVSQGQSFIQRFIKQ